MLAEDVAPDLIVVDGSEGGTWAAPLEFADHLGHPLTEGLLTVHNALVGTGLRERIRLGASRKVATGADIVKRMIQGADHTNSARAMMFAVGCIQAQRCHTNTCTGRRPRSLHPLRLGERRANHACAMPLRTGDQGRTHGGERATTPCARPTKTGPGASDHVTGPGARSADVSQRILCREGDLNPHAL